MEKITEIPRDFKTIKNKLLREFPKEDLEGINIKKVERYIESEGLTVKPYVVFYRDELPKIKQIEGESRLLRDGLDKGECGLYSPEMDMGLIVRDKEYEESNGTIFTEGMIVHELAHASSMHQSYITTDNISFYTPRVGFCLPQNKTPWGWVLEEGWADMHRANYVSKNASELERQKVFDSLHFGELNMEDTLPITIQQTGKILPIPVKYVYITPEGIPSIKSSSFAAYAIEILCKNNPNIKPLLKEARFSVDGLRKLSKELGKDIPEFYKEFHTKTYSENDFSDILSKIIGDKLSNYIVASGQLKKKWDDILSK
jgi:hypothetical protein